MAIRACAQRTPAVLVDEVEELEVLDVLLELLVLLDVLVLDVLVLVLVVVLLLMDVLLDDLAARVVSQEENACKISCNMSYLKISQGSQMLDPLGVNQRQASAYHQLY